MINFNEGDIHFDHHPQSTAGDSEWHANVTFKELLASPLDVTEFGGQQGFPTKFYPVNSKLLSEHENNNNK